MTQIETLLKVAAAEIGTKEYPPKSNSVKYNTWFYYKDVNGPQYPWCMVFVAWCFEQAGLADLWIQPENTHKTALCQWVYDTAKVRCRLVTSGYKPGDVLLFDFNSSGKTNHTGICESVSADGKTLTTIEGNTSATSDDNGGAVMRRTRKVNTVLGAFRPQYAADATTPSEPAPGTSEIDALVGYGRITNPERWKTQLLVIPDLRWVFIKWLQDVQALEQEK